MSAQKIVLGTLFVLACLGTVVAGLFVIEDFRGRAAWREYQADAAARGVALRLEDYLAPMPPPDQNFAAVPLFADLFSDSPEKKARAARAFGIAGDDRPEGSDPSFARRTDLGAWATFLAKDGPPIDQAKAPPDRLIAALDRYAQEDAELRIAAARPACRFPVKWEDGLSALLPHLSVLMNAARVNGLRLEAHAAQGNRAALDDFRLGMRLVAALEKEPALINGVVRVALFRILANAVWSGFAAGAWDAAALQEIERSMAGLNFLEDWKFCSSSERAAMNVVMEQFVATNPGERNRLLRDAAAGSGTHAPWGLLPRGWLRQNMVRMNQYMDEVTEEMDGEAERFRPAKKRHALPDPPNPVQRFYYSLGYLLVPAFDTAQRRFMEAHTLKQQVMAACALERYRRGHGAFPETLAQIVPEFSAKTPHDVIDGQPLRYRREGDTGYLLYSIGRNGRDDGGAVGKTSNAPRPDWVWRLPGSEPAPAGS